MDNSAKFEKRDFVSGLFLKSGFGPFALERLAATSGGRFPALWPSGGYGSQWPSPGVPRFDPKKMRRYAPDNTIEVSSALERLVDDATEHLQRVVDEHSGTPWALIAERELAMPIGWKWTER